jgi:hypothetical protein
MQQTANLQNPAASRKGLILKTETKLEVPPFLKGDPIRLQHILTNLIGNAVKFTEEGSVSATFSGEFSRDGCFLLCIEVSDTGIGIPFDKQDKIFAKFTQADVSTARKYGGTGLGLSITRHLVSMMSGTISLESREGQGSQFKIVIPLEVSESPPEELLVANSSREPRFKGKVLVVDDHPVNLLFMRTMLELLGLEGFDEATGGEEALRLASRTMYDLILMDCQMPGMDGMEATRQIRASSGPSRSAPIVALTADAMKGAAQKCLDAGMNNYISKPVDRLKLVKIMEDYLETVECAPTAEEESEFSNEGVRGPSPEGQPLMFDRGRLEEFMGGDSAAIGRIINTFFEQMGEDIERLEQALQSRNFDLWKGVVHKLYGACANVGAGALSEICDRIHTSRLEESDIKALHQEIMDQYRELSSLLRQKEAA